MIIFPENNPATRNSFSCGQSKQACSAYHSNFQVKQILIETSPTHINTRQMCLASLALQTTATSVQSQSDSIRNKSDMSLVKAKLSYSDC